ncbi:hypothetical protein ACOSQ4_016796 [Xanthoceras sorbifolium]
MSSRCCPSVDSQDFRLAVSSKTSTSKDSLSGTSKDRSREKTLELPPEFTAGYDSEEYYRPTMQHERFAISHLVENKISVYKIVGYLEEFSIPPSVVVRPPRDDEPASGPRLGSVAFHPTIYEVGAKLPLQPYLRRVLREIGIAPAQLNPNGWRILIGMWSLWKDIGATSDPTFREI